jgi:hypothetical protein
MVVTASRNESPVANCSNLLLGKVWNSGWWAPAWIEIDLGQPSKISCISLIVYQHDGGDTRHIVTGGEGSNPTTKLCEFEGFTSTNQELKASFYPQKCRFVRITTTKSPSWVSWASVAIN